MGEGNGEGLDKRGVGSQLIAEARGKDMTVILYSKALGRLFKTRATSRVSKNCSTVYGYLGHFAVVGRPGRGT